MRVAAEPIKRPQHAVFGAQENSAGIGKNATVCRLMSLLTAVETRARHPHSRPESADPADFGTCVAACRKKNTTHCGVRRREKTWPESEKSGINFLRESCLPQTAVTGHLTRDSALRVRRQKFCENFCAKSCQPQAADTGHPTRVASPVQGSLHRADGGSADRVVRGQGVRCLTGSSPYIRLFFYGTPSGRSNVWQKVQ